ncbi:MAG: cob(I)yrinic acid a,c-diamide adenosyltransferase [Peptostreptococcaceae bacterium]|nr:cob(I)yrinic acid a,c-diamide adenosyltransferase [Peptostreptococcaceae bacterium]
MLEKGYVQVYTGNGKGKTTAALGLVLRTICSGNKAFIGQFMKGQDYSELKAAEFLPGLKMEQFGGVEFLHGEPTEKDLADAENGLSRMKEIVESGEYDVIVFDEINTALFFKLLKVEEVIDVINLKKENTELILTGRYAPEEIIDRGDLVTEMKEIKHYYNNGVKSRTGIEN